MGMVEFYQPYEIEATSDLMWGNIKNGIKRNATLIFFLSVSSPRRYGRVDKQASGH